MASSWEFQENPGKPRKIKGFPGKSGKMPFLPENPGKTTNYNNSEKLFFPSFHSLLLIVKQIFGTKYSRMDQVKFVEDSL